MNDEKSHDTPRSGEAPQEQKASSPEPSGLFDKVWPEGVKKGIEGFIRDGKLKNIVGEIKLPREIITHIKNQVDDTKQATIGVISREVRLFLERTNLADELAKLLTQISFQVKTEIRFVPNDQAIPRRKNRADKQPEEPSEQHRKKERRRSLWPLRVEETKIATENEAAPLTPSDDEENERSGETLDEKK